MSESEKAKGKSKKLFPIKREGNISGYLFWCPGCEGFHSFNTKPDGNRPVWKFNNDVDKPTFSPSLGVKYSNRNGFDCHLFLQEGKLRFLKDCDHHLAGNTVELPDLPEGWQTPDDPNFNTQD